MFSKEGRGFKPFSAVFTRIPAYIPSRPIMHQFLMALQVLQVSERFGAVETNEGFLVCMRTHVVSQGVLSSEGFVALGTGEGPLVCMPLNVVSQCRLILERFAADGTFLPSLALV